MQHYHYIRYIRSAGIVCLLALFWIRACDEGTTEPEVHPLAGVWELTDLEQTIVIKTAEEYLLINLPEGATVVDTTLTWDDFQQLGVSFSVDLNTDNSFSLTGSLPVASDTLGVLPRTIELTDQGTWSATENLTGFTLEGTFYSLSGALSVNNPENPATISLYYAQAGLDTVYFPVDTNNDQKPDDYLELFVYDSTATTLQFSKQ